MIQCYSIVNFDGTAMLFPFSKGVRHPANPLHIMDTMNDMRYFIITNDNKRSEIGDRLFGVNRLPVIHKQARWQPINGRDTYAYDLHLAKLSQAQRDRFAAYVARRTQRPYVDVKIEFDTALTYPITARGCTVEIEDNETAASTRPFFIYSLLRIVKNQELYRIAGQ